MKEILQINREECRGLYGKLFLRINELERDLKGFKEGGSIPWREIYKKLGRNFAMSKLEIRETIILLSNIGFLKISPMGIKINFKLI